MFSISIFRPSSKRTNLLQGFETLHLSGKAQTNFLHLLHLYNYNLICFSYFPAVILEQIDSRNYCNTSTFYDGFDGRSVKLWEHERTNIGSKVMVGRQSRTHKYMRMRKHWTSFSFRQANPLTRLWSAWSFIRKNLPKLPCNGTEPGTTPVAI